MKRLNYLLVVCIGLGLLQMGCSQSKTYDNLEDFEGSSGLNWIYLNNTADNNRTGGFGQTSEDTANDGSGNLEISEDPADSSNHVLSWTFEGSPQGGASYFDLFLLLDEANWRGYIGIKFDVKIAREGSGSDRNYFRLQARLNQGDGTELFGDDDEAWRAYKLDVGYNGWPIPDADHPLDPEIANEYEPFYDNTDGVWPQNEFEAEKRGWTTFELNFDKVSDTCTGFYLNPSQYDIGPKWAYGADILGITQNEGYNGIIQRNALESFRLMFWLSSPTWIGVSETITIYIDNVQLVKAPGLFG